MTIPWIPLFPDANNPVTEVLGYPTSIITASSGREQRIRLRQYPEREFTMRMVEMRPREISRLLFALEQGHDFYAYVPFWPEAFQLTADHIATDVTLNVDRTTERIQAFGQYSQALLWRGDGNVARYTITADSTGTIDIDPPLAENWPAGTWVVPQWLCQILGVGTIDRVNDDTVLVETLRARISWINPDWATPGVPPRRKSRPCDWVDSVTPGDLSVFDNEAAWTEVSSAGPPEGPAGWSSWGGIAPNRHIDISGFVIFDWNDDGMGHHIYPIVRWVGRTRHFTGLTPGAWVGMTLDVEALLNGNDGWSVGFALSGVDQYGRSGSDIFTASLNEYGFWQLDDGLYKPQITGDRVQIRVRPDGTVDAGVSVSNIQPSGNINVRFWNPKISYCRSSLSP